MRKSRGHTIVFEEPSYSVSQLSQLAGVSVRTLHYYDKVGLLKPQVRSDKGYRFYGYQQLVRLQQILIYRELDFSLEQIATLLNSEDDDLLTSLENQRLLLLDRQTNTQSMIKSIEVTMTNLKAKQYSNIFFADIPKEKAEALQEQAESAISDEARNKFQQWFGALSEDQVKAMKQQHDHFNAEYQAVMHLPVEAAEVQALAESHYEHMNWQMSALGEQSVPIGYQQFVQMAEQITVNAFFRDLYENCQVGMADHFRRALLHYAENTLKDAATQ